MRSSTEYLIDVYVLARTVDVHSKVREKLVKHITTVEIGYKFGLN